MICNKNSATTKANNKPWDKDNFNSINPTNKNSQNTLLPNINKKNNPKPQISSPKPKTSNSVKNPTLISNPNSQTT